MEQFNYNGFKRINKKEARNAFMNGGTLHIQPCNLPIDSRLMTPYVVSHHNVDDNDTFDSVVNAFEGYNCDNERGKYATFYVRTK